MRLKRAFVVLTISALVFLLLTSCSKPLDRLFQLNKSSPLALAEVLFRVKVPSPFPAGSTLMLEILDDVTGVYFNSTRYELTADDSLNLSVRIPLPVSADVKYRYVLSTAGSSYEFNSLNQQVRFRIVRVNGPEIVDDLIAAWVDTPYAGSTGRISGQVIDAATNAPIPNLLVTAGGLQTISASDGSFTMNGLAPGLYNLVIYSMDGIYETFQQGAVVAANANTPVDVILTPRSTTQVTFEVILPLGVDRSLPVRFISNLLPLGNAYADLSAGSAGSAVNYPVMKQVAANRYTITLNLPIGFYLRYKYSLGDGFWNAELDNESKMLVRELLITENLQKKDRVVTFTARGSKPVHLLVVAPADTPTQESVFVQLNPFGWMEPLPMVNAGINLWKFTLYSPLQYFDQIGYRYCRNGQCDVAPERTDASRSFMPGMKEQTLSDIIFAWENLDKYVIDTTQFLSLESVQPKPGFIAGVELVAGKPPAWRNTIDAGLKYAANTGGDWVILKPTWAFFDAGNLPGLAPSPDTDLLWPELINLNSHVMMSGQKTLLFPVINYAQNQVFQETFSSSDAWKLTLSEEYTRFIYHNADLAQFLGIEGLIIEDPAINPITGSAFAGFSSNSIPWEELISGIRQRYSGRLIAAVNVGKDGLIVPDWLDQVDIFYVKYAPPLQPVERSVMEIRKDFETVLLEQVKPVLSQYGKPVILGFTYESMGSDGAIDLAGQAKAYSAAILSVASQDWINGFISRGYYPYVELQDTSSTIYRKPASEILWFWFHYLLSKPPE